MFLSLAGGKRVAVRIECSFVCVIATGHAGIGWGTMKSAIVKRSIRIDGHKTSVSVEEAFWRGLKEIADAKNATLTSIVAEIDTNRITANLSSAIRLFVLEHYRALAADRCPSVSDPSLALSIDGDG
jgi:predicted DNA-binding ribbon-helix-helix protein